MNAISGTLYIKYDKHVYERIKAACPTCHQSKVVVAFSNPWMYRIWGEMVTKPTKVGQHYHASSPIVSHKLTCGFLQANKATIKVLQPGTNFQKNCMVINTVKENQTLQTIRVFITGTYCRATLIGTNHPNVHLIDPNKCCY